MTTMNISLPDEMRAFVESRMAREGHASASEYLRALTRQAQRRLAEEELEAKLLEGLAGPATPMAREDWDAIREEVHRRHAERQGRATLLRINDEYRVQLRDALIAEGTFPVDLES